MKFASSTTNVTLEFAHWSGTRRYTEITVFDDHVADNSAIVERLRPSGRCASRANETPAFKGYTAVVIDRSTRAPMCAPPKVPM
jgi:hypothetical protein